jgi:hypothetical protein
MMIFYVDFFLFIPIKYRVQERYKESDGGLLLVALIVVF